jgi:hypothetical protein
MTLTALLVAACLLAPVSTPAPAPVQGGGGPLAARADGETVRVLGAYFEAQGGLAALLEMDALRFDLVPVEVVVEEGSDEPVERPQPPLAVEVRYTEDGRAVRIDDVLDGRPLVKIHDGGDPRIWHDGEERRVPELIAAARAEAASILAYLDLLFRPGRGDLRRSYAGVRERDGVAYDLVTLEFHPSRAMARGFRLLYDPGTHLVAWIQEYDLATLRVVQEIHVDGWSEGEGVRAPSVLAFHRPGRERPRLLWRLEAVDLSPELTPERFQKP